MTVTIRPTAPDLFELGLVASSGGWDLDRGFFLGRPMDCAIFRSKAEATKAARSIGWEPKTVERCYSRFMTRFYALHHPRGGFITPTGLEALRAEQAAQHSTCTYQRRVGERYITKSNGSCGRFRPDYETTWVCSCGNGGFGEHNDRASARIRAKQHREDPEAYPGRPWKQATVTYVSTESDSR